MRDLFVVQSLSHVWLFATTWPAAYQASPSPTVFQSLPQFMSIELVMLSNHLILCHRLLLSSLIFPSIRVPASACVHAQLLSCVWLFVTSWTVACQSPLSMGLSRQENWAGLPFPSPGDFPNPGMGNSSRVFGTLTPPSVSQHWSRAHQASRTSRLMARTHRTVASTIHTR